MQHPEASEALAPLRAAVARAMQSALERDHSLLDAVAIHEVWSPGYCAKLLVNAELLATARLDDFGLPEPAVGIDDAVRRTLENANPRLTIPADFHRDVPQESRAQLIAVLHSQAEFHATAAVLDRRHARRPEPDDNDHLTDTFRQ